MFIAKTSVAGLPFNFVAPKIKFRRIGHRRIPYVHKNMQTYGNYARL